MITENVKEYELIRQEMIILKECITKYIGFVLGGTGLAVYGMMTISQSKFTVFEICFTCFILSIIMSFVLLILFYKFYSHNRLAGYCKLLNHERHSMDETKDETKSKNGENISLFAWEICIERLRASDMSPKALLGLLDRIKIKDMEIKRLSFLLGKYTGKKPEKDKGNFWKGLRILLSAITGKVETRSWGYPPMIVAMFFIIILGFLCGGIYTLFEIYQLENAIMYNRNIMYFVAFIIILAQIFLWSRFIGKLSDLMGGSATVDGYFWRFMLVRTLFLNRYNITPEFLYADERLEEAIEELGTEMGNRSSGQIGI